MMTYDLKGAWNSYTAHHTALYTNDGNNHDIMPEVAFSVKARIKYLEGTYVDKIDMKKI